MRIWKPLVFWASCLALISSALLDAQQNPAAPDPASQEIQRGRDALAAGKYDEAIGAFRKAAKLQKRSCADCYLGLALAYLRKGDLDQALSNGDKAISSANDNAKQAMAHSVKGSALTQIGTPDSKRLSQAETEYRASVTLAPDTPVFHMNLARALLKESKDDEALVELKKCLELNPSHTMASEANMLIAEPRRGRENFAPEFHFTSLQGQEIDLKQLTGKTVVLDFWATWCQPCRESVGELKNLTRKYANGNIALISVSADDDDSAWRGFIAQKGMDWPQLRDANGDVRTAFAVRSFPTYLVIDGEGIIRQRLVGLDPQETVVHRLKDVLAGLPPPGVTAK